MSKKKEKQKSKEKEAAEKVQPEPSDGKEKPFDFGGLPERDLKKNLGCG